MKVSGVTSGGDFDSVVIIVSVSDRADGPSVVELQPVGIGVVADNVFAAGFGVE